MCDPDEFGSELLEEAPAAPLRWLWLQREVGEESRTEPAAEALGEITQGKGAEVVAPVFWEIAVAPPGRIGPNVDNQQQPVGAFFGERVLGGEMSRIQSVK